MATDFLKSPKEPLKPHRYLGLELAGAKNQKTALAAIEYYPKEKKIFLLDIYDHITPQENQSGDEALLEIIEELNVEVAKIGVNVPLELPPCMSCTRKSCPLPTRCTVLAIKWMRKIGKNFTPYTQRPFELWARYRLMPALPPLNRFDIDETLGGNKAPLTARLHFLKRHLAQLPLIEAWPKLTVSIFAQKLGLHKRVIANYRHLEEGMHSRSEILEALANQHGIFIYDRDLKKLSHSLNAFDAFICAYTALLSDTDQCEKPPRGFPLSTGWVSYPKES